MKQQPGFILVGIFITFIFLAALGIASLQLTVSNFKISQNEKSLLNAQMGADAAVNEAIAQLKTNGSWTGTSGTVLLHDATTFKTEYSTVVTQPNSTTRVVNVVSNVYVPKTAATPTSVYKYEVTLKGASGSSPNDFAVASGPGGLAVSGGASIDGGPLFINGEINMTTGSEIGDAGPLNVYVAHQSCPTAGGATYPRVCASGEDGQPITLAGGSTIQGTVRATNQTTTTGMSNPGLVAGSTAPETLLPNYDRSIITSATASTQTGAAASCSGGAKTWPANLKINGDVMISSSCDLTIEGNVWVTGRVQVTTNSIIIVKNGLTTQPVLMIDGSGGFAIGGGSTITPNSSVSPAMGLRVITMYSSSACSPDCTTVTGSDLKTSQSIDTISISTGADAAGSEFYARWTEVVVNGNATVGALAGQTISVSSGAELQVNTSVVDFTPFGTGWKVQSIKRVY